MREERVKWHSIAWKYILAKLKAQRPEVMSVYSVRFNKVLLL